jgi:hypothetical protein
MYEAPFFPFVGLRPDRALGLGLQALQLDVSTLAQAVKSRGKETRLGPLQSRGIKFPTAS